MTKTCEFKKGVNVLDVGKMNTAGIKDLINKSSIEELERIIPLLMADNRVTVRDMAVKLVRRLNELSAECERINGMKAIERKLRAQGYTRIAGIDEVGRGPLSGPVVVAAVVLPEEFDGSGIKDSKMLTPQKRSELYCKIKEKALDIGIGIVHNDEIDRINIQNATHKAAALALAALKKTPDCIVLDAMKLPGCKLRQESIIKGDQKCLAIAAASIIAKVERDRYMEKMDSIYPVYGFAANKGYGTTEHIEAIKKHGLCRLHRKTFITGFWNDQR
jgi:ribonuclease HII